MSGACTTEGHVRTQQSGLHQTPNQTQPPKLREINASSLNHPACGTLSQQPELTDTTRAWANPTTSLRLGFLIITRAQNCWENETKGGEIPRGFPVWCSCKGQLSESEAKEQEAWGAGVLWGFL